MRPSLISLLACPDCAADLVLRSGAVYELDDIEEATLECLACGRTFPVQQGILRAMPSTLLAEQESEIRARDEQVAQYDGMWYLNLFGLVEIPMTLRRLSPNRAHVLLEGGAGTGRMTPHLAERVKDLVSVDFSFESLRANRAKLLAASVDNVDLVQADLCNLPFRRGVFDRVLSCQVIEHIPGPEARGKAVACLSRVARKGATVVISAYQHSLFTREKEGQHDGGIPFFRFTRAEFRDLLGTRMRVNSVTGKLMYLFLAHCTADGA